MRVWIDADACPRLARDQVVKFALKRGFEVVLVAEHGGRAASYLEEAGSRIMKHAELTVRIDLARGNAAATVWTCDFSYDYVKINADYRS